MCGELVDATAATERPDEYLCTVCDPEEWAQPGLGTFQG